MAQLAQMPGEQEVPCAAQAAMGSGIKIKDQGPGGKAATRRAPALPVSMSPQYKTFFASGKSTLALVTRTTPVLTNGATFLPSMTLISVFTPSAPIE